MFFLFIKKWQVLKILKVRKGKFVNPDDFDEFTNLPKNNGVNRLTIHPPQSKRNFESEQVSEFCSKLISRLVLINRSEQEHG